MRSRPCRRCRRDRVAHQCRGGRLWHPPQKPHHAFFPQQVVAPGREERVDGVSEGGDIDDVAAAVDEPGLQSCDSCVPGEAESLREGLRSPGSRRKSCPSRAPASYSADPPKVVGKLPKDALGAEVRHNFDPTWPTLALVWPSCAEFEQLVQISTHIG